MGTRMKLPARAAASKTFAVIATTVLFAGALTTWPDSEANAASTNRTKASGPSSTASLPARSTTARAVTVKVQPRTLNEAGAVFKVIFDTHSVNLDQDLVKVSKLVVGTKVWPVASWTGGKPGGHHREGELRFTASGPASGTATLSINGLPAPFTFSWKIPR